MAEKNLVEVTSKLPDHLLTALGIPKQRMIDPTRDVGGGQTLPQMGPVARALVNGKLRVEICG